MQVLATPPLQRQKRSLSYNDLKRKRLIRSAQSQKKLHHQYEQSTVKKQGMSEAKTIISTLPQDQKVIENCITELKVVLGTLRQRSSKKRLFSIKESMTERPSLKQSLVENPRGGMWENMEEAGSTKQLIKRLLNKNKSQRRLVKFNDIRDKFKKEKERSLSHETPSMVKHIPSPVKLIPFPAPAHLASSPKQVRKEEYARQKSPLRYATQLRGQGGSLEEELEQIGNLRWEAKSRVLQSEIGEKQNESLNAQPLQIIDVSAIGFKEGERFNESDLRVLAAGAGEGEGVRTCSMQGSFLRLMNENTEEGRRGSKAVRRRGELERMKRIFPSGFFDN